MQTIARFLPGSLFRRWLDVRAAEVQKEIAVKAIYEAGREHERRLIGAAT